MIRHNRLIWKDYHHNFSKDEHLMIIISNKWKSLFKLFQLTFINHFIDVYPSYELRTTMCYWNSARLYVVYCNIVSGLTRLSTRRIRFASYVREIAFWQWLHICPIICFHLLSPSLSRHFLPLPFLPSQPFLSTVLLRVPTPGLPFLIVWKQVRPVWIDH